MTTKLHAFTDADGRQTRFFRTGGLVSDHNSAAALLGSLPAAEWLPADRGYDADWFREALKDKGDKALHSRQKVARQTHQARQATLQTPQQDRDHVRACEGLATGRHTL